MDRVGLEGCHMLEGNGCISNFFYYVWKKKHNSVSAGHDLKVPSTVVYCDGFPKEWHVVTKQGETERRIGKEISTKEILKDMCTHGDRFITEDGGVVAWYLFKVQQPEGGHKPAVEYFDRKGLDAFLHGKVVRRDGFLQKFVYPDGKHCVVIQAIWSPNPAAQLVGKRENNMCFHDRRHPMGERITTFEGPTHFSREAFVAPHIQWQVKRLCKEFVDHFRNTEHAAIQRMVLYFKVDRDSELWFLWCSSMRIYSYGKSNPLDLCVEYLGRDNVKESLNPHGINLIEGATPDYGTATEDDVQCFVEAKAPDVYNPCPPSIGPIRSVFSRCATPREKALARKKVQEKLRSGAYFRSNADLLPKREGDAREDTPAEVGQAVPKVAVEPRSPVALAVISGGGVSGDPSRRMSACVTDPPGVIQDDATFMGYKNIQRNASSVQADGGEVEGEQDDEWQVLLKPLRNPRPSYFWELVRIALHTGFLGEMSKEAEFQDWIQLNGTVEASRQSNVVLPPRTEVFMSTKLHDTVGQPLASYLAMFQVTVRRVDVPIVPAVDHAVRCITGKKGSQVSLQIGKQQNASVLWNKIKQFCNSFFTARCTIVKENYEKYKQRALRRELKEIGAFSGGPNGGPGRLSLSHKFVF